MPQRRIQDNLVTGLEGMAYASAHATESLSALNDDPRAKKIVTFTVSNASTEGSVFLEGLEISSATGLADESAVAADLVSKINAEGLVNGVLEAEQSTADVVVTAKVGGTAFAFAAGTNTTAVETQANATADPVPFGRLVMSDGQSAEDGELLAKLADASSLTAKSVDLDLAAIAAGDTSLLVLRADGQTYEIEHTGTAGGDTDAEHATAVAALINGTATLSDIVTASTSTNTLTIAVDTAGDNFEIVSYDEAYYNGLSSTEGDRLADLAIGVSKYTASFERAADEDGEYPANSRMNVQYDGPINVKPEDSPSTSDPVYVRLSTSASEPLGKFRGSFAAGCVRLPGAKWIRGANSDDLAVLQLNL